MKILTLDIETAPNTAHVWGLWNNNVSFSQLLESGYMLCWAASWEGTNKVIFRDQRDVDILSTLHALLDETDIVCHYNGRKFDIPNINREFLEAGLTPPSPYKQIDLYDTVKRKFRFQSNKLDYVCQHLGIGKKTKHEGHELWAKAMNGDFAAMNKMKRYCVQDVRLTKALYQRILPWIDNHPNRQLYQKNPQQHKCPNCGGDCSSRGVTHTHTGTWKRYRCSNCGKWSRGEKVSSPKGLLRQP